MILCNSLRYNLTVQCLAALLAASFSGRCFAVDDPPSELQLQRAKISELQQQILQQQASAQSLQQELQQRQREMTAQQQQAKDEYRAAQRQYEEMEAAAARAAEMDRQVAVYSLQYLQAQDAAAAISRVLNPHGSDELSVAVDTRANRLIASSTAAKIKDVESLLQKLDVATARSKEGAARQTAADMLQVRIIWLTDRAAANDTENVAGNVDDRVLKALVPLGFASPTIVCQTVTSVVVNDQQPNEFAFTLPVTLDGTVTRFQGSGTIDSVDESCYLLKVKLVAGSNPQRGTEDLGCQVQGAISTPLKNYTVLGTGVVVTLEPKAKQVPCAFVLQLNNADSIPSGDGEAATGN